MWSQCGVYAIVNIVNGMVYVGETERTFAVRWAEQIRALDYGEHCTAKLQSDWLEYGRSAFEFEILEVISAGSLPALFLIRERHYMMQFADRLYNRNGRKPFRQHTTAGRYLEKHGW